MSAAGADGGSSKNRFKFRMPDEGPLRHDLLLFGQTKVFALRRVLAGGALRGGLCAPERQGALFFQSYGQVGTRPFCLDFPGDFFEPHGCFQFVAFTSN